MGNTLFNIKGGLKMLKRICIHCKKRVVGDTGTKKDCGQTGALHIKCFNLLMRRIRYVKLISRLNKSLKMVEIRLAKLKE